MKKRIFHHVAILGLGLIGGSIALDLKKKQLATRVVGYNRSKKGRDLAMARGACDAVYADPAKAVRDCDLVILATPVQSIPLLVQKILPNLQKGTIVTDVGSTKKIIQQKVSQLLPAGISFIGGHPIAGTENSGMSAAMTDLFKDRWWILTPHQKNPTYQKNLKKMLAWAHSLGAKTALLSADEHDDILAAISHLPNLLGYSLMNTVASFRQGKALLYAGSSFRGMTRVAASSPQMWSEICLDNSKAIVQWIERLQKQLELIKKLILKNNFKGLTRFFEQGAKARRKI